MITRADVEQQLERARQLGYLGDGPVSEHFDHAAAQLSALGELVDGVVVDLGSGGGVPGLLLPLLRPERPAVLLDRQARRTAFLRSAVAALGVHDRVDVVTASAEDAAWDPDLRGVWAAVVARSFGPPAVVTECGAGFLAEGGVLLISEPPEGDRWSDAPLEQLGLALEALTVDGHRYVRLRRVGEWPGELPRAERLTRRRPLW